MNTRANRRVPGDEVDLTGRHAVVLGGSLAGLLAARILADHFDKVTILERDAYFETTEVRKGIPQANHVHGLLLRGRRWWIAECNDAVHALVHGSCAATGDARG